MNHRLECGPPDCLAACACWCHVRCGAPMRYGETCNRRPGHGKWRGEGHRSRYAMENRAARLRAKAIA